MDQIPFSYWKEAISYNDYRQLVIAEEGPEDVRPLKYPPHLFKYVGINNKRMDRWDRKSFHLEENREKLQELDRKVSVLCLTEGWCGDAAHILPVVEKLFAGLENFEIRYLFRDENPDLMEAFLTNGGRSIPKYIFICPESMNVLGSWGPRPAELQNWYMDARKSEDFNSQDAAIFMQSWYNRDKGRKIIQDFTSEFMDAVSFADIKHLAGCI